MFLMDKDNDIRMKECYPYRKLSGCLGMSMFERLHYVLHCAVYKTATYCYVFLHFYFPRYYYSNNQNAPQSRSALFLAQNWLSYPGLHCSSCIVWPSVSWPCADGTAVKQTNGQDGKDKNSYNIDIYFSRNWNKVSMLHWSALSEKQPSERNSCVKMSMKDGRMRSPLDGPDITTIWCHNRHGNRKWRHRALLVGSSGDYRS